MTGPEANGATPAPPRLTAEGGSVFSRETPPRRPRRWARLLVIGVLLLLGLGAAVGGGLAYWASTVPLPEKRAAAPGEASAVAYRSLPRDLVNAILVAEDRWFYRHGGIEWSRMLAEIRQSRPTQERCEGGRTITQKLVRTTHQLEGSWPQRAAQDVILTRRVESRLTKAEIFERYLNRQDFGHNIKGIGNAAHRYFGKEVGALSLAETAMLAGVIRAPSRYSPASDLAAAQKRAGIILQCMVEAGLLSPDRAAAAQARPAQPVDPAQVATAARAPAQPEPPQPATTEAATDPVVAAPSDTKETTQADASQPAAPQPVIAEAPAVTASSVDDQAKSLPSPAPPFAVPALPRPPKAKPLPVEPLLEDPGALQTAEAGPAPSAAQTGGPTPTRSPSLAPPVIGMASIDHLVKRKPDQLAAQQQIIQQQADLPPSPASLIQGRPIVMDTATLRFDGRDVRLVGVQPGATAFARSMQAYIGGHIVTCRPYDKLTHTCEVEGYDLSEVVLHNGGARSTRSAPAYLLDAEARARSRRMGVWGNG